MPMTRRLLWPVLALPALRGAAAAGYPDRPVRIVLGYVAGGGADVTLRILAPSMAAALGQPVVVDNRPGGAGNLANELVARAPADGHTLLLGTIGPLAVNPAIQRGLAVDPATDLAPISLVVQVANLLVVPADRPWRSVAELLAAARAAPGRLTYGSASVGSAGHLAAAALDQAAGTETVHVPYRGGGQLITDLLAGGLDYAFATAATTLPYVQDGRLRALAVPTAARSALVPEVPTVAESGVPGFDVVNWYGLLAPRGTPEPVLATAGTALRTALANPEAVQRLAAQGLEPLPSTPEAFATFLRAEIARWTRVVRAAGIGPG